MYTPEDSPFEKFRTEKLKGVAMSPDVRELVALAYESGFIDGMQKQMQSSVDRAVNRMAEQPRKILAEQSATELRRLYEENENLRSVMIAAAEEIAEHWDAHCNEEGYGPANLMHRLERGIPAQYGYKAGDFAKLMEANKELLEALTDLERTAGQAAMHDDPVRVKARASIAKAGEQP